MTKHATCICIHIKMLVDPQYDAAHSIKHRLLYFHENATLNIVYYCDQFYLSCSILAINRPCSATNTKDEPNLICHSLLEFCSIIDFQGCECCCLLSVFSSKFQSSMRVLLHLFIRGVIRKTTMMT